MALMTDRRIRHLPVVENGALVGIISIGDVVRAVVDSQQFVIKSLENYIMASPEGGGRLTTTSTSRALATGLFGSERQSPGKTTHYLVFGTGTLLSAEDDISAGKLVISGVSCKKGGGGK